MDRLNGAIPLLLNSIKEMRLARLSDQEIASIKGTHVHVSKRHLAKYLAEFEFRWNLRDDPASMFPLLLKCLET